MSFVRFALLRDVPPGTSKSVRIGLKHIAVFNQEGTLYAIEDACAHMKAPLSGGRLRGTQLTCSRHGWVYDIVTGRRVDREGNCVHTFQVKVEGETIFVDPTVPEPVVAETDGLEDDFPRIA